MYNMNEQNQTVRTIRTMLTAPLFLTAIIAYSVYGALQLIGSLTGKSMLGSMLDGLMEMQGGYGVDMSYLYGYSMGYNFVRMIKILLGMLPVLLIVAGMWMVFMSAKNEKQSRINPAGLTMIRVIVIIQLIGICIFTVLGTIGFIYILRYIDSPVVIFIMLLLGGIAAAGILYYLKLSQTIQVMKNTILTEVPNNRISGYVMVICAIMGVGAILSAVPALLTMSLFELFSDAALATSNIAFAIYLSQYKQNMNRLRQNPNENPMKVQPVQPPYSQPVQQANPQGARPQPVQPPYSQRGSQANPQGARPQPVQPPYSQRGPQANPQGARPQPPHSQMAQQANPQGVRPQSVQPPYSQTVPQANPQEVRPQPAQPSYAQGGQQANPQGARPQSVQPPYSQMAQAQNAETTLLDYYNETSVLSGKTMGGGQTKLVRWTRQKTGEIFCINKEFFWIGKGVGNVDYCITDNTAVSRRHVLISLKNGCCFVRDNHSTNGAFLNGKMIPSDTDTKISDGDRVRLADEEFIVNIE